MMKINVLIINYKSRDILDDCLLSINEEKLDIQINILNNDCDELILSKHVYKKNNINIVNTDKNIGFSEGINYLVKIIPDTEYFFLLNPDAILTKNVIYSLYKKIELNNKAAAISPVIYDSSDELWFNYGYINWKECSIHNKNYNLLNIEDKYETDIFNGCAALLKTSVFKNVGMFKKDIFMYYDEAFLSMSFKSLGYKIYCSKVGKVIHNVSYSTKDRNNKKIFYMVRNGFSFFYLFHGSLYMKIKLFSLYIYRSLYYIKNFNLYYFITYYKALFQSYKIIKNK